MGVPPCRPCYWGSPDLDNDRLDLFCGIGLNLLNAVRLGLLAVRQDLIKKPETTLSFYYPKAYCLQTC